MVDEQHRFGVRQRAALDAKAPDGERPHVLHMTATPIPRTLALSNYGDLDSTLLHELPAGRRPIKTLRVLDRRPSAPAPTSGSARSSAPGRQAFVVCPLVSESEVLQARAATAEFERLRAGEFRDFEVVLMHGQLAAGAKQEAMAAFASGAADVLVATSVIEVGIDVPNATVMLVEDADRYGISQLHQLRGRIGRGAHDSVCLLFGSKDSPRLRALASHGDGFELAEIDLELRGRESWSARASTARRSTGWPSCRATPSCSSEPGGTPSRWWPRIPSWPRPSTRCWPTRWWGRSGPRRWRRSGRDGSCASSRVVSAGAALVAPRGRGDPADVGSRARGAVLDPAARPQSRAPGCSTCSPGRARWGSRRCRGGPPRRCSSTPRRPRWRRSGATWQRAGCATAEVRRQDALAYLRSASRDARQYDLVFLDPPYRHASTLGRELSTALGPVLAPAARVVAESDRRAPLELDLALLDERRYGDTLIRIHGSR